jgi:glyoxylase-like metal-dependent hydrolase (beta-lactamase superfamily II)
MSFVALFAAASILAGPPPKPDFDKVEVKATLVAGNVYLLTGAGGNIAASIGEDGIVLIDDQFAPLAPKIEAALHGISPKPVRYVLNTHWHADHTGGNATLGGKGSTIVAHENVRKRLREGATVLGRKVDPAPNEALPLITFNDQLTVHLNGDEIRAVHVPHGHTDGDTVIFFSKANVVHMGDDFVTYGFPFIDTVSGGSVRGLIAGLEKVIPELPKDAKIIPGHGALSSVEDVAKFAKTLEEIVATVDAASKHGQTLEQMKKANLLAPWTKWNGDFVKADQFLELVLAK